MIPGVFAAYDEEMVDRIIASQPKGARFVAQLVVWRRRELAYEVEQSAWHVLAPDAATAMGKSDGLWERLVRRSSASACGSASCGALAVRIVHRVS